MEEYVSITLTSAIPDCLPKLAGVPLEDIPIKVKLQSIVAASDHMLGITAVYMYSGNFYVFTR